MFNKLIEKVDSRIFKLNIEQRELSFIEGFVFGEEIPYKSDFYDPLHFEKYFELQGAIDVLTFLKDEVLLDITKGGFVGNWEDVCIDDKELLTAPSYLKKGHMNAILSLGDMF